MRTSKAVNLDGSEFPQFWFRPRAFAREVGLSEQVIYGMLRRKEIRALHPGESRFLIPVSERDRLLAARPLED